ncbi:MAG: 1-acyl-sn-glycerol-3-phosphate acyltransferase [Alphaproteobacteria bacterium]|nr:1-acyl-sn-glycerol-3-phosphate acyltransferase [Alphaproteobacteria bacterium]
MKNKMAKVRKQNLFNTITGSLRFAAFWIMVVVQLPIIALLPRRKMITVKYMAVFMKILLILSSIKIVKHGQISKKRPLLVAGNHISVFEIATFPVMFGGSFISKNDVRHWPLVGYIANKFGVVFIDRRPSHAMEALKLVQDEIAHIKYPLYIFPEGTTTNGAYVKEFKSSLFNVAEGTDVTVQPVVTQYCFHDGTPIGEEDLAEHYAYFDNAKQTQGPKCSRERSAFGQIFHVMVLGGFTVNVYMLPPPPLAGMDRKEMANAMHKLISDKYTEIQKR